MRRLSVLPDEVMTSNSHLSRMIARHEGGKAEDRAGTSKPGHAAVS
jgi:hypothetical protein